MTVLKLTSFYTYKGVTVNSRTYIFQWLPEEVALVKCYSRTVLIRLYYMILCLHTSLRFNFRVFSILLVTLWQANCNEASGSYNQCKSNHIKAATYKLICNYKRENNDIKRGK